MDFLTFSVVLIAAFVLYFSLKKSDYNKDKKVADKGGAVDNQSDGHGDGDGGEGGA